MWYIIEYDHVFINNEQIKHEIQIKNKTRIQFEKKNHMKKHTTYVIEILLSFFDYKDIN